MYVVAIGSKSEIKKNAIINALMRIGVDYQIVIKDVPTGVPAQPVGDWETSQGAQNRAKHAAAMVPGSWGIGIENGIAEQDGKWLDLAAVAVVSPAGEKTVSWSEAVEFPTESVDIARQRGFASTTAGSVIAERYGCAADDPHAFLTGGEKTRVQILTRAVEIALKSVWPVPSKGEEKMGSTHRIVIGDVVRELPIREVKPGIRVALFNILGDWELTEAAGKALAARLPQGIDALVMPDGKATALLHVLGRETKLPTFVARKEKKPYMAEPVRIARYGSITTDRVQSLYMGDDDASKLRGQRVLIVDDVVSTGGTLVAMRLLMIDVQAEVLGVAAIFTEGDRREDVVVLDHLPLF